MAEITGGVKFYEPNFITPGKGIIGQSRDPQSNAFVQGTIDAAIDNNIYTQYESNTTLTPSGEDVTIQIIFPEPITVDTFIIERINLFGIFPVLRLGRTIPRVGLVNFNGDTTIGGSGIFDVDDTGRYIDMGTAFFQSNEPVTIDSFQLRAIAAIGTNPPGQRFKIGNIIITKEIGTLRGYPNLNVQTRLNQKQSRAIGGKSRIKIPEISTDLNMRFRNHPYQEDIDLVQKLEQRQDPFLIHPSGGRAGEKYFKLRRNPGWRIHDIYLVNTVGNSSVSFQDNTYLNGINKTVRFTEHIHD